MSKQTEALKLALEALEYISSHYMSLPKIGCMALAAVEEALAEQETVLPGGGHVPAVPVAVYGYCPECGGAGVMRERRPNGDDKCTNGHKYPSSKALAEQPAQQEPVSLPEKIYEFVPTPEPVKWHHPECEGQCIACLIEQVVQEAYGSQGLGYLQRHLTSPPQRKPLTDEQIWDEVKAADLDWQTGWSLDEDASNRYITFARAIEAAHGIKENT